MKRLTCDAIRSTTGTAYCVRGAYAVRVPVQSGKPTHSIVEKAHFQLREVNLCRAISAPVCALESAREPTHVLVPSVTLRNGKAHLDLNQLSQHSSSGGSSARNGSRSLGTSGDQRRQRNSWRVSSKDGAAATAAALFFTSAFGRRAAEWRHGIKSPSRTLASFVRRLSILLVRWVM